jgi:hypothetical protein
MGARLTVRPIGFGYYDVGSKRTGYRPVFAVDKADALRKEKHRRRSIMQLAAYAARTWEVGRAPYGYRASCDGAGVVKDAQEQECIAIMREMMKADSERSDECRT